MMEMVQRGGWEPRVVVAVVVVVPSAVTHSEFFEFNPAPRPFARCTCPFVRSRGVD